jgi:hypothetical protein
MSARSVSGLDLAEDYYHQVVRPITEAVAHGRPYGAALIGPGSEVQGFDTARSADHAWGSRVMILLRSQDVSRFGRSLDEALSDELPESFRGYPSRFSHPRASDPARHCVEVTDLARLGATVLGFDPGHM